MPNSARLRARILVRWLTCSTVAWRINSLEGHRRFQAAYLNGHPLDDPAANPLRADLTGFPPILIQAAAGDQFARGAHELAERAHRYGVRTTEELYPVNSHDFQSFWSFLPEATDALRQAGQFIRDCSQAASTTLSS